MKIMTVQQIIEDAKARIGFVRQMTHSEERFEDLIKGSDIKILAEENLGDIPSNLVIFPGVKQIECYTVLVKGEHTRYCVYLPSFCLVSFNRKPTPENVFLADKILRLELEILQRGEKVWRDGIAMSLVDAADTKDVDGLLRAINEYIA